MAAPTPMPHISDWRKQGLRSTAYMKFQGDTRAAAWHMHAEIDDDDIKMSSQTGAMQQPAAQRRLAGPRAADLIVFHSPTCRFSDGLHFHHIDILLRERDGRAIRLRVRHDG